MASSAAFESDREMALRMQQAIEEEDRLRMQQAIEEEHRLKEQQQAIAAGAVARAGARAARAGGVRLAQNNQHCTAEDAAFKADLKAAMVASKQATLGGDSGRATSRQWGGRKGDLMAMAHSRQPTVYSSPSAYDLTPHVILRGTTSQYSGTGEGNSAW